MIGTRQLAAWRRGGSGAWIPFASVVEAREHVDNGVSQVAGGDWREKTARSTKSARPVIEFELSNSALALLTYARRDIYPTGDIPTDLQLWLGTDAAGWRIEGAAVSALRVYWRHPKATQQAQTHETGRVRAVVTFDALYAEQTAGVAIPAPDPIDGFFDSTSVWGSSDGWHSGLRAFDLRVTTGWRATACADGPVAGRELWPSYHEPGREQVRFGVTWEEPPAPTVASVLLALRNGAGAPLTRALLIDADPVAVTGDEHHLHERQEPPLPNEQRYAVAPEALDFTLQ